MSELVSETFGFAVVGDSNGMKAFESTIEFDSLPPGVNLFAVGNASGTFVCTDTKTIKLGSLADLNSGSLDNASTFEEDDVYQLFYSADESWVYVLCKNSVKRLNVSGKSIETFAEIEASSILPSPIGSEVAILADRSLSVYDSVSKQPREVSSGVSSFAWTTNADDVLVGNETHIKVVSVEGTEKVLVAFPEIEDAEGVSALNIFPITVDNVVVTFAFEEDGEISTKAYLLDISQKEFTELDVAVAFGSVERTNYYYAATLKNWIQNADYTFITAGAATDLNTILSTSSQIQTVIHADDQMAATFPMTDDGDDVSPIGIGLDLSNAGVEAEDLCTALEKADSLPKVWVYTHECSLISWWVYDVSAVKEQKTSLERARESLKVSQETTVPTKEVPAAKASPEKSLDLGGSAFGSTGFGTKVSVGKSDTPSFGSTGFGSSASKPAFGSTGFGSSEPKSAFGSTGFGNTESKPAFGSTGFGSTETKASFGSTGFGSTETKASFGSTGFGNTDSKPSFGSTGFGSNSTSTTEPAKANDTAKPAFGSTGFGSSSSKSAFGSTGFNNESKPAFGSTGFGTKPSFGSTGFGNSSSGSSFGNTGFGSVGGSGFSSFANKTQFGSSKKDNVFGSSKSEDIFGDKKENSAPIEEKQQGSLFGSSTTKPSATSGFGSSASNAAKPAPSFRSTQTSKPAFSGFGSSEPIASPPKETPSPFGGFSSPEPAASKPSPFGSFNANGGAEEEKSAFNLGGLGSSLTSADKQKSPLKSSASSLNLGSFSKSFNTFSSGKVNEPSPFSKLGSSTSSFTKTAVSEEPEEESDSEEESTSEEDSGSEEESPSEEEEGLEGGSEEAQGQSEEEDSEQEESEEESYGTKPAPFNYGLAQSLQGQDTNPPSPHDVKPIQTAAKYAPSEKVVSVAPEPATTKIVTDPVFHYYDGPTKPITKSGESVEQKTQEILNTLNGFIHVHGHNVEELKAYFDTIQEQNPTLNELPALKKTAKSKAQEVRKELESVKNQFEQLVELEKLTNINNVKRMQIDKTVSQLKLHLTEGDKLSKYYPLDIKNLELQLSIRKKLADVYKLKDDLIGKMMPLKAQIDKEGITVENLQQTIHQLSIITNKKTAQYEELKRQVTNSPSQPPPIEDGFNSVPVYNKFEISQRLSKPQAKFSTVNHIK